MCTHKHACEYLYSYLYVIIDRDLHMLTSDHAWGLTYVECLGVVGWTVGPLHV